MKKRLLALILCASLIFALAACSGSGSGGSADPKLSPSEQAMANFVNKLSGNVSARDLTRYYYEISGFDGLYLAVNQPFKSRAAAEKYLDKYTDSISEQGYISVDPRTVGSNKTFAYNNEELQKFIAFDLLSEENGAAVSFNFISRGPLAGSILAEKAGF